MLFHNRTNMVMPYHKKSYPRAHNIYNFGRPFLALPDNSIKKSLGWLICDQEYRWFLRMNAFSHSLLPRVEKTFKELWCIFAKWPILQRPSTRTPIRGQFWLILFKFDLSDLYPGVEIKKFKGLMHFHCTSIMAAP